MRRVAALAACLASLGCASKKEDRPAARDVGCVECVAPGLSAGSSAASTDAGVETPKHTGDVSFEIKTLDDQQFSLAQSSPLKEGATLRVQSAADLVLTTEALNDRAVVGQALLAENTWAAVLPYDRSEGLPTLQHVDTRSGHATLAVVRPQVVAEVFADLLLAPPLEMDPVAAQAVLHIVNATTGQPLPRVTVSVPNGLVLYESGGVFSADLDDTGSEGLVLLANVAASLDAVASKAVTLGGAVEAEVLVDVLAGAVTLRQIVVR
jgi:hypothetical protein